MGTTHASRPETTMSSTPPVSSAVRIQREREIARDSDDRMPRARFFICYVTARSLPDTQVTQASPDRAAAAQEQIDEGLVYLTVGLESQSESLGAWPAGWIVSYRVTDLEAMLG